MNIALIGYGKMGHAIEEIAVQRGHAISLKIRSTNRDLLTLENLMNTDVAIEFSQPEAAQDNVLSCLRWGVPVVSGTTGWNTGLAAAKMAAMDNDTAFLHASNFSIGVNLFFTLNRQLAALMNDHDEYDVRIIETHHTQKKDAPSGTAITLAEQVLENIQRKKRWAKKPSEEASDLQIVSHRIENVPGTHEVQYTSHIDDISIVHTAHSREGFARGAVIAAEYVAGRKGIFTMKDVLSLK